jgi:peptidyl-prolyl cis-trans isomerase B (cyclophilin B)
VTVPPPYPPYTPYPAYRQYPQSRTNALAIASLVCAFLVAPLAILFGHMSLSQIKRSGEQGRGLAVAGLVIGYVVTVGTILAVIAGTLLFSWAARVARNAEYTGGNARVRPSTVERNLPEFTPPPGLGSACAYPATSTPASKPVTAPPGGPVSTDPPVVDAVMTVDADRIGLMLDNAKSPCTVNSFISLARQRYFDGTTCHRLSRGPSASMLQCGDPTASGSGGPGYRFDNEYPTNQYRRLDPALREPVTYPRGTLAMANAGPDSNGSQFLIVYRDSKLPPTYTVFGRVDDAGMAAVDRLVAPGVRGGGEDGEPAKAITITSLTVK